MGEQEPIRYQTSGMKHCPVPYGLIWRRYWKSFVGVSFAWFVYE